jgi:flagellar hook-length control protein FliK
VSLVPAAVRGTADEDDPGTDAAVDPAAAAPDAPAPAPVALAPVVPPLPAPVTAQATAPAAGTAEPGVAAVSATPVRAAEAATQPADAVPAAPVVVPTAAATAPTQTPDEVAAPAAPARAQAPDLVGQLGRPLHGLRSFGDGTHVITIRVTPENLGPVAVRAHVSGDSMRIELVAPTDQAREAIKSILPDLRRDLSGAGGQTTLDLSSGNQPSGRESAPREAPQTGRGSDDAAPARATGIRTTARTDVGLDVLA